MKVVCTKCNLPKEELTDFYQRKGERRGRQCKGCLVITSKKWNQENVDKRRENARKSVRKWQINNPEDALWLAARTRAKRSGRKFSIKKSDVIIPEVCPILGIALSRSIGRTRTDASPSLDAIIPERGYTPGNVQVISWRANWLKGAGSLEEHQLITKYMEQANSTK